MKKDFKRPNGTTKRVQYVRAPRKGISSMGSPYRKGDAIVHLSSSRCTGETFVLLPKEVIKALFRNADLLKRRVLEDGEIRNIGDLKRPGRWASPKRWSEDLSARWHEENCWLFICHGGPCPFEGASPVDSAKVEKGEFGEECQ